MRVKEIMRIFGVYRLPESWFAPAPGIEAKTVTFLFLFAFIFVKAVNVRPGPEGLRQSLYFNWIA